MSWLLYKTNRFHFSVGLYSDNPQRTSKRGKNISHTTTNKNDFREMVSESEESDGAISLRDIVLGCTGIDMKTNRIQPPPFSSSRSDGRMLHVSRSRAALHMEDQTGLFGFYDSDLTKDAEA